jgi:hypothetical protein
MVFTASPPKPDQSEAENRLIFGVLGNSRMAEG